MLWYGTTTNSWGNITIKTQQQQHNHTIHNNNNNNNINNNQDEDVEVIELMTTCWAEEKR